MSVITEYEQVLIGNLEGLSLRYFPFKEKGNEQVALSVFRYAIEELLEWTPTDANRFFSQSVAEGMKLTPLLAYIDFPSEITEEHGQLTYILYLLYPKQIHYDFREQVIEIYQEVLLGKRKYPRDYMYGHKGLLRAEICLQYVLNKEMIFNSKESLYGFFVSDSIYAFLKEKKLYQLYRGFFDKPLDYLHESLPDGVRCEFLYQFYTFARAWKKQP